MPEHFRGSAVLYVQTMCDRSNLSQPLHWQPFCRLPATVWLHVPKAPWRSAWTVLHLLTSSLTLQCSKLKHTVPVLLSTSFG